MSPPNFRTYGKAPFRVVLVHGGPGAAGQMAPVARKLSGKRGILEPLQTETTVNGQISELKSVVEKAADLPVILVGFSWGAWLGLMTASAHPDLVARLILIGCGPLGESYAGNLLDTRLSRLEPEDRKKVERLLIQINDPSVREKNRALARLGKWFIRTDAFDPITLDPGPVDADFEIHRKVWSQAAELRRSGKLLNLAKTVSCPVVAIHGDHDPHPEKGIREPLEAELGDFRFHLVKKCGHVPWIEKWAAGEFYRILEAEI